ncbi:TPA: hypothetical protein ACS50C_005026 [Salmonella enterica]|uniref:hypothetical protein n=1 Tax=Salmonella enterica TaxID=28901 RepID=UPI001287FBB0|nr:hypothetical protein [Salmonella enterica]EBK2664796.1 hypothetical protein [Salmonella enterica subsp. enterica serovar Enteritidis]EBX7469707.1 hypothetical protein [Salmonella enterica subsp. enterica serovar Bareilly]ECE0793295.1 hypothetical protein [Salmonella enterica subsp. diarizonae]ECO0809157.1 hypothetical protein [Salmonella enterica subsp. enterica serovar Newport]EDW1488873.1 hypothetical protein [Salmonella enterica subsp. enterica serovar Hvittingfoss]EDW2062274.1 hypothet
MSQKNEFTEARAICNEIGGAVLEILAQKRELSVQSLIDVIEKGMSGNFTYTSDRVQGMEWAVNILKRFI